MSYIGGEGNGDVSIFPGQGHKKKGTCVPFFRNGKEIYSLSGVR